VKKIIKHILYNDIFLKIFGSTFLFRFLLKNSTVIFLYHEVTNEPSEFHKKYGLNVTPKLFKDQIKMIKNHFNVIDAKTLLKGNYKTPAALITFDDGSKGNYTNAYPILEELKCPSLMFLNMGPIKGEIFWSGLITYLFNCDDKFNETVINKNLNFLNIRPNDIEEYLKINKSQIYKNARRYYGDFMNTNDLKKMSESSFLSFGNHLYQHYNCANCSKDEIVNNYVLNHDLLKNYKNYSNLFSYPFGQKNTCYNDKTNNLIFGLGADAIFTANPENFLNNGKIYHRFSLSNKYNSLSFLRMMLVIRKIIINLSLQDFYTKFIKKLNKN
jgi:peptidoglycan/xylan/chitin deacetylase (PgdA/CDA1 family)